MKFTLPVEDARLLLGRLQLFASPDDSRPILNTVRLEAYESGFIRGAAADGFALAVMGINGEVDSEGAGEFPLATVKDALRVFPKKYGIVHFASDSEGTVLAFSGTDSFSSTTVSLTASVVEGKYPDYAQLIRDWDEEESSGYIAVAGHLTERVVKAAKLDKENSGIVRWFTPKNPHDPITALINGEGHTFVAVVMPMFVSDSENEGPSGTLKAAKKRLFPVAKKARKPRKKAA